MKSTDPRQLLTCQPINDTTTTELGDHLHESMGIFCDLTDDGRLTGQRMGAHHFKQAPGILGRTNGYQLAFVGDI